MIARALDTFGTALARGACAAAQLLRRAAQRPRGRAWRSAQPLLTMLLGIVMCQATADGALAEALQDAAGDDVGRAPPAAPPIDAMRPAFIHGGTSHGAVWLLTLGMSAALCALIRVTRCSRMSGVVRRGVALLLSAWLLGAFGAEQWSEWSGGSWSPAESLPLHLCDLGLAVTVAALLLTAWSRPAAAAESAPFGNAATGAAAQVTWSHRCGELAYFWGLGGTLQALLTPDVQHDFPAPECVRFFAAHAGIVVGVLVLTFGLGLAPAPARCGAPGGRRWR